MKVVSPVNVANFKHLNTSGQAVPISLHPYPVLSIMPNEESVVEIWKMMSKLEQHFAILHADYNLIPQLLKIPNELNVPHIAVPIKKIGLALPDDEGWKCFKYQLKAAGYPHSTFIQGSTSIQLFPLTRSSGDKSVFGCGLGGVCVPVPFIEHPVTTENTFDALEDTVEEDNIVIPKKRFHIDDHATQKKSFDEDSSSEESSSEESSSEESSSEESSSEDSSTCSNGM
jgi:hypothetical protein